jgi:hypothetical protein
MNKYAKKAQEKLWKKKKKNVLWNQKEDRNK